MEFIGREQELSRIDKLISNGQQGNALVFGRRRIGKSELIKQAIKLNENATPIYYECRQTSEADNISSLAQLASTALGFPPLAIDNVRDIIEFLFEQAKAKSIVLVIDEYPYLRNVVKGLDSILQTSIDAHREDSKLKIILCGSYVEIMRSLVEHANPLYGRIDLAIELGPMDYHDAAKFYPTFSAEDKVRLYSVLGGVPYYNRLVAKNATVRENVIELISAPGARLENEIPAYLGSEISKITNANEVFSALAQGYSRWKDLRDQSHVSSGPALADVLEKLQQMSLVQKQAPINDPGNKRKTGYHIIDSLTLFYYRYIFKYLSQRQLMEPEAFYKHFIQQDFEENHVPHMFEEICKQYLVRQNQRGLIPEPFDAIGRYWYDDPANHTSGEFDAVTHDSKGYVFYEAKFRKTPVSQKIIKEEIAQVQATGLDCYAYGFFSRSGFKSDVDKEHTLISLEEMY